jgi:hypothetical protein
MASGFPRRRFAVWEQKWASKDSNHQSRRYFTRRRRAVFRRSCQTKLSNAANMMQGQTDHNI